jgi:hypothetical protein
MLLPGASYGTIRTVFPLQVRTIFSSSGIGIDNFKLSREQHASRYAPSIGRYLSVMHVLRRRNSHLDGFKKRFTDTLGQADAPVLTEDLRNMIMTAESDQDINTVIQALKKSVVKQGDSKDRHLIPSICLDTVQPNRNSPIIISVHL